MLSVAYSVEKIQLQILFVLHFVCVSHRYTGELTEIPLDLEDPPALVQLTSRRSYQLIGGSEERLSQDSYAQALKYGK